MQTAKELIDTLNLEPFEVNIFKGQNHDIGVSHVFGGQVLAQALHAAIITTPEDRFVHSMHAYFILPGDLNHHIVYQVEPVRDGGSFSTRRVRAIQHGKDIFILAASFQLRQEGFCHQIPMPEIESPEDLLSDQDLLTRYADQLPNSLKRYMRPRPIEFRPVDPMSFISTQAQDPLRYVWFKAKGDLPDDPTVHQRVLAYASDYNLLTSALLPHQDKVATMGVRMASIDHAMWFHQDFRADEWMLYAIDSPSANNARGFTRGSIFKRNGELIASVAQEGLIRSVTK